MRIGSPSLPGTINNLQKDEEGHLQIGIFILYLIVV